MTHEQTIALARVVQAGVAKHQAISELDEAINAALDLDLSTRQIARCAGLEFSTIARRARILRAGPTRKD